MEVCSSSHRYILHETVDSFFHAECGSKRALDTWDHLLECLADIE